METVAVCIPYLKEVSTVALALAFQLNYSLQVS